VLGGRPRGDEEHKGFRIYEYNKNRLYLFVTGPNKHRTFCSYYDNPNENALNRFRYMQFIKPGPHILESTLLRLRPTPFTITISFRSCRILVVLITVTMHLCLPELMFTRTHVDEQCHGLMVTLVLLVSSGMFLSRTKYIWILL
jgi:hypothetical protein